MKRVALSLTAAAILFCGGSTFHAADVAASPLLLDSATSQGASLMAISRLPQIISRPAPAQPAGGQEPSFPEPLGKASAVKFEQLPVAVQRTIMTQTALERIDRVERGVFEAQTVYQVAFQAQGGDLIHLRIAENGAFLARATSPAAAGPADQRDARLWGGFALPLSGGVKVTMNDVPAPARERILATAAGARIEDVVRGNLLGVTAYQAAFKLNGVHQEMRVRQDGQFIEQSADQRVTVQSPWVRNRLTYLRNLPQPVQTSIQEQTREAMIETVRQEFRDGQTVYHVSTEEKGMRSEFAVGQEGQIVQAPTLRDPAGARLDPAERDGAFRQLPYPVQQTLRSQAHPRQIEQINRRLNEGQTFYEIGYRLDDGRMMELLIDESGRIHQFQPER